MRKKEKGKGEPASQSAPNMLRKFNSDPELPHPTTVRSHSEVPLREAPRSNPGSFQAPTPRDPSAQLLLRRKLLELTESDPIPFYEALNKIHYALEGCELSETFRAKAVSLINRIEPPIHFLSRPSPTALKPKMKRTRSVSLPRRKKIAESNHEPSIFIELNKFIEQLRELIELFIRSTRNYDALCEALRNIVSFYEKYKEDYVQAYLKGDYDKLEGLKKIRPVVITMGATRYLKPEIEKQKLSVNRRGELESGVEGGTHGVTTVGGIYHKREPSHPGIEFSVGAYNHIFYGAGSPPTLLYKFKSSRYSAPILASLAVTGLTLFDVLKDQPSLLKRLDHESACVAALSALGTYQHDGHAGNYVCAIQTNASGQVRKLTLSNIDQDLAFAMHPIILLASGKYAGKHAINVRNVLFCLEFMNKPLAPNLRRRLANKTPAVELLNWLKELKLQNHDYAALYKRNIFSPEEWGKLKLPIKFVPGTLERMLSDHNTIRRACQIRASIPTLNDIFKSIHPTLFKYYQFFIKKYKNPLEAYMALTGAGQTLEDTIECDSNNLKKHQAGQWDFIKKRTQSIEEAVEELVSAIDFKVMKLEEQRAVLDKILEFPECRSLHFRNCSQFTTSYLKKIARNFSRLDNLVLEECGNVSMIGLRYLPNHHPNIKLTVKKCLRIKLENKDELNSLFESPVLLFAKRKKKTPRRKSNAAVLSSNLTSFTSPRRAKSFTVLPSRSTQPKQPPNPNFTSVNWKLKKEPMSTIIRGLEMALQTQIKTYEKNHHLIIFSLYHLGDAYLFNKNPAEALKKYRAAFQLCKKFYSNPKHEYNQWIMAKIRLARKKLKEANANDISTEAPTDSVHDTPIPN